MQEQKSFFEKVYAMVRMVPYGRVTTYGAIAKYIGSPQASRMVGWALNNSHSLSDVPAHRVVNRNGFLTGKRHFGGERIMAELLESENIKVENDRVIDFNNKYWEPDKEV